MNIPPSLEDDDQQVILDDLLIEEFEPSAMPLDEQIQGLSTEKHRHFGRWVAIAGLCAGAVILARTLSLRARRRRRFARLLFGR
jgi:hypothetical protein